MSNIDRRYSYHDDGVLPSEGEYGVTYLTLYSSGAGNVYDGWMWDPDRVHYSETERTFGYRNPDYPDYCWDDEVVVDLSNAQTRQETSDFAQGRITSYNTNVSSAPIFLPDIDVTGMDEDEREANATTVLFSAIPLVKDAYIHAEVEVAMKMNISPDNTDGRVRVEAFYIINDDSDRTMRPHPVHHFSVSENNEYNILRLLYWNPAIKHDTNNFIGVKLICSGGTAEIGISDDPDYGDAIITLTSAGLVGDVVYDESPQSLSITGKTQVAYGYKFDPSDYTVTCTYANGVTADVTELCSFYPFIGTEITSPTSIFAYYMNLDASINVTICPVDHIVLTGLEKVYGEYYFDLENYLVTAVFEDETELDVTYDCTFNIEEGTLIEQDTTLIATYTPSFMTESTFTDSMLITKSDKTPKATSTIRGLTYTAYEDDEYGTDALIVITGNSYTTTRSQSSTGWANEYSMIALPTLNNYIDQKHESEYSGHYTEMDYVVQWQAKGDISGINFSVGHGSEYLNVEGWYGDHSYYITQKDIWYACNYFCKKTIGFEKVKIVPQYKNLVNADNHLANTIRINLAGQRHLTNYDIPFLYKMNFDDVDGVETTMGEEGASHMFTLCQNLVSISFLESIPLSVVRKFIKVDEMFAGMEKITDFSAIKMWYLPYVYEADGMFARSGIRYWPFKQLYIGHLSEYYTQEGVKYGISANYMFARCPNLSEFPSTAFMGGDTKHKYGMYYMFLDCYNLSDISRISSWSGLDIYCPGMFCNACVRTGVQNLNTIAKLRYSTLSNIDYKWSNYNSGSHLNWFYDYDPQNEYNYAHRPPIGNWYVIYDTLPPFIGKRPDYHNNIPYPEPDVRGLKRSYNDLPLADLDDSYQLYQEWPSYFQHDDKQVMEIHHEVCVFRKTYGRGDGAFSGIPEAKQPSWYRVLKEQAVEDTARYG